MAFLPLVRLHLSLRARSVDYSKLAWSWVNIFRYDDLVGTDIEPGGEWPENRPVDPGGHTGYWTDRQVFDVLRAQPV